MTLKVEGFPLSAKIVDKHEENNTVEGTRIVDLTSIMTKAEREAYFIGYEEGMDYARRVFKSKEWEG